MELYNADELVRPDWMDENFFATILRSAKIDEFETVISSEIGPATSKGDHFASVIFRAIVLYLDKKGIKQEISMIIKTLPEHEGSKKDMLDEIPAFETEIDMFENVIHKFEDMLRKIGDKTTFAAKMLYYSLSPRKIIVLEDLKEFGFSTIGQRMCTLHEAEMVLDMLAKWNACSYILNQETSGSLEGFTKGFYSMPNMETNPLFSKGAERLVQIAKKTPKLKPYVQKLENLKSKLYPKCRKVYDLCREKGRINVLSHGDLHSKNLMFNFNMQTQQANKVIFIDFQESVWCSMAIDLLNFMYVVIDSETRMRHRNELIYNYFEKFRQTLKDLGFKGKLPTFLDLQADLLLVNHIEVLLAIILLPFVLNLIENPDVDFETVLLDEEWQLNLLKSEAFMAQIESILKDFLHKGYLDYIAEDED